MTALASHRQASVGEESPLRIAMIGQRGLPATFGGVEHHVEELASRLVARGHDVTVFTRASYGGEVSSNYRGIRLRRVPTLRTKHLDAIVHSFLCTTSALFNSYDIVHYHALGPGIPAGLLRLRSRTKLVLTVHGLDGDRAKWGGMARSVLKTAEWLSARVPHETIVVSRDLKRHYLARHGRSTTYIPNGVDAPTYRPPAEISSRFGLERHGYILFVGRLVPEKAPDLLMRAFRRVPSNLRLVVAGGSSFTDRYVESLKGQAARNSRVVFTGYVYDSLLEELYSNAAMFVLPSSLEGLPLTLLEAASYGIPVVASDIPPHAEVIGTPGPGKRLFPSGDEGALASTIEGVLRDLPAERAGAQALPLGILRRYRWDEAVEATLHTYRRLVAQPLSGGADWQNVSPPTKMRVSHLRMTHTA
jgi:glycosyltransferase involved in cell wall biosynthesis